MWLIEPPKVYVRKQTNTSVRPSLYELRKTIFSDWFPKIIKTKQVFLLASIKHANHPSTKLDWGGLAVMWWRVKADLLRQHAIRTCWPPEETFSRWITAISTTDRPRSGCLFLWAPYLSRTEGLSMDPTHPSLSEPTQVQDQQSHSYRELMSVSREQDLKSGSKTVVVLIIRDIMWECFITCGENQLLLSW